MWKYQKDCMVGTVDSGPDMRSQKQHNIINTTQSYNSDNTFLIFLKY
jgi:hypothetical protein